MNRITDIFVYSLVVAGILVLTRPGSQGPAFVTALGTAWSQILRSATGGGTYHPPQYSR